MGFFHRNIDTAKPNLAQHRYQGDCPDDLNPDARDENCPACRTLSAPCAPTQGGNMNELTHKVEITISGNYPHGARQHASVSVSGDGGLDHMIEAFKAALIAAGFAMDTAKKLDELDA